MSEDIPVEAEVQEEAISQEELIKEHLSEIDAAFEEVGFFKRLGRMFKGLGAPRASAEYKLARTELQRLVAPMLAVICPVLFVVVLCVVTEITGKGHETIQIDIARAQTEDVLDDDTTPPEIEQ